MRRIESRLRRYVGAQEPLLALEFGVVITNVVVRLIDLRLHVLVIRLERIQGVTFIALADSLSFRFSCSATSEIFLQLKLGHSGDLTI